jgi:hypothetical protein
MQWFCRLLFCSLSTFGLIGQIDHGNITGIILDPQQRAVQDSSIQLSRQGLLIKSVNTRSGQFDLLSLAPGSYQLRVKASGFAEKQISIEVAVRQTTNLRLMLSVADRSDTVQVTTQTSTLNFTDASLGNRIEAAQIVQLPLESRNVTTLLSLQPGVVYLGENNFATRTNFGEVDPDARNGSVNGGRSDQANVTLDGVDVNDQQTGFAYNSALRVTTESIQEFRVVTFNPTADLGRSSGAQVALVTRRGENTFHGVLFHSHRNTVTSANTFFNNRVGVQRPKLIRNVFGGNLGGLIYRDRAHFFFNYEGRRDASELSIFRNVPLASLRNGNVRYRRVGGQIVELNADRLRDIDPANRGVNPSIQSFLRQFPLPNDQPTLDPLNFGGFRFNSPIRGGFNVATARFDFRLSDQQNLFVRANLQDDQSRDEEQFPGTGPRFRRLNNSRGLAFGHNWTPAANWSHSFRYGLSRISQDDLGATNAPQFSLGGGIGAPIPFTYSRGRITPTHNFVHDVSWWKGNHTLRFGGNVRLIDNRRYNVEVTVPLLVVQQSRLANLGRELLPTDIESTNGNDFIRATLISYGVVSQGNARYNWDRAGNLIPNGTALRRDFATEEYEGYLQDSWRVRPNFTITAGLRYSISSPIREVNGNQVAPTTPLANWFEQRKTNAEAGVSASAAGPLIFELAGPANQRPGFYRWDKNNWSPRIAAVYSPGKDGGAWKWLTGGPGKTVFRGGVGLQYDRIGSSSSVVYDTLGSFGLSTTLLNAPGVLTVGSAPRFSGVGTIPSGLLPPAPSFEFPKRFPGANEAGSFAITFAPDSTLRSPYGLTASFSVQRELSGGWTLEGAYAGRESRQLPGIFDAGMPVNLRDPASGTRYFDAVNQLVLQPSTNVTAVTPQPYWENLFPGLATTAQTLTTRFGSIFGQRNPGLAPSTPLSATQTAYFLFAQAFRNNYRDALNNIDRLCVPACGRLGAYSMYSDQFASLVTWRSIVPTSYHSGQLTARKRLSGGITMDFNYTFSKSLDWVSGTERSDVFSGTFIVNSLAPEQMRGPSDFDLRHQWNANWVAPLPFGNGRIWTSRSRILNQVIGGWQAAGIARWTSGFPVSVAHGLGFPTNYYTQGFATPIGPLPESGVTKDAPGGPNLFGSAGEAFSRFAPTLAGQTGVRNNLRGDGFSGIDLGLSKVFDLPGRDGHQIAFRWEIFNATNSVRFNTRSLNLNNANAGAFGRYASELTVPRAMQFLLRYQF